MGTSVTDGSLMHLNYEYGDFDTNGDVDPTKNSGNIAKQTITVSGMANPFVQKYQYDPLDRISEAKETVNGGQTWIQQFGYDRYGNRTSLAETVQGQSKPISEVTLPSVDANTNRFSSGTDYEYDAVGNLIRDAHGRQFTFNGDNKQTLVKDQSDTTVGEYFYDGNGKRVKKVTASEVTVFVYDAANKLIGEYSTDPPSNPTVNYTATDPLGSPRVITNKQGEVLSRRDFMPFGEEVAADATYRTATHKYGIGDGVRQKFTGYERDEETGLDFAEARYYYNDHGRFTAVDPLLASGKSANPQTFNRYAYTMNRPLILTDETGLQSGQRPIKERAAKVRVPNSATIVTPSAPGIYTPAGGGNGVNTEFTLSKPMIRDLQKIKRLAYQLQFVITKDKLNEATNGRVIPTTGSNSDTESTNRQKSVEKDLGVSQGSNGSPQANLGVKSTEGETVGASTSSSEQGKINSNDAAKADTFDLLEDEINNFAAKYEGTTLTGYTDSGSTVHPVMEFSFFAETAKREIALSREDAMDKAILANPEQ